MANESSKDGQWEREHADLFSALALLHGIDEPLRSSVSGGAQSSATSSRETGHASSQGEGELGSEPYGWEEGLQGWEIGDGWAATSPAWDEGPHVWHDWAKGGASASHPGMGWSETPPERPVPPRSAAPPRRNPVLHSSGELWGRLASPDTMRPPPPDSDQVGLSVTPVAHSIPLEFRPPATASNRSGWQSLGLSAAVGALVLVGVLSVRGVLEVGAAAETARTEPLRSSLAMRPLGVSPAPKVQATSPAAMRAVRVVGSAAEGRGTDATTKGWGAEESTGASKASANVTGDPEAVAQSDDSAAGSDDAAAAEEQPSPSADSPAPRDFDQAAARAALGARAAAAVACAQGGGATARAVPIAVTFAPSGRVTTARVTAGLTQGTNVGSCVAMAFRGAAVPAFAGQHVTVTKTIRLQ